MYKALKAYLIQKKCSHQPAVDKSADACGTTGHLSTGCDRTPSLSPFRVQRARIPVPMLLAHASDWSAS